MNKPLKHSLIVLFALFLGACDKENMGDCFKSTGKTTTEVRAVANIKHIVLEDRIDLYIRQAPSYSLEVKAGKNLHRFIETKAENGTLTIENNNTCNWVRSLKRDIEVYLSLPEIESITFRGGGNIQFQNQFNQAYFFLDMWDASGNVYLNLNSEAIYLRNHEGTADIYCSGTSNRLESYSNGQGTIDSRSLICKEAHVINNNSSQILLSATDELHAEIRGRGDIKYLGSPIIQLQRWGSGQLIAL